MLPLWVVSGYHLTSGKLRYNNIIMSIEKIRGKHNEIIWYVEDKQDEIILRDSHNVRAGRYSKIMNRTYDAGGRIVSNSGNTLLMLLNN